MGFQRGFRDNGALGGEANVAKASAAAAVAAGVVRGPSTMVVICKTFKSPIGFPRDWYINLLTFKRYINQM